MTAPRGSLGARTFRSLRIRNFRLFFLGQLVSVTGTWMQTVAQSWLVLNMTRSGLALGVTFALQFLPMLAFGMWGGVLADRCDKRRLLLSTQVASAILALILWALVATESVELWMVYVLAFLLGCVTTVDMPTRQSFVIEMVGAEEVPNAVGLNSAMFNTGRMLGPAAAAVLIASIGITPAFLANAVSYLAAIAALAAMRTDDLFRQAPALRTSGEVRAGFHYAWDNPALRSTLLLLAVLGLFGFNFVVILPLLARFTFGGGASLYSVLTSVMAAGSLGGALFAASQVAPTRGRLVGSAIAFGVLMLLGAAAPNAVLEGIVLTGVGVSVMVFLATANATLQLNSDPAMRGRVMALYSLVFLGSTPIGGPLLGWISERWGARYGLGFGGALSLGAVALLAILQSRPRSALATAPASAAGAVSGDVVVAA